jgi:hypothetical protein
MRYIGTKFGHAALKLKPDMKLLKDGVVKLTQWLIFNVCIALTPILINYLKVASVKDGHFEIDMLFAHGELLLISVAIAAEAIGGLMVSKSDKKLRKLLAGGASIMLLILASFWFADIVTEVEPLDVSFVASTSLIVFAVTLFTSGNCKLLSEA